jgi:hypothetical protein
VISDEMTKIVMISDSDQGNVTFVIRADSGIYIQCTGPRYALESCKVPSLRGKSK